jgi:hypothetical protein
MTKDEALKIAINTMEIWNGKNVKTNTASFRINFDDAINACKEALEQPAQDYVLICKRCGDDLGLEYVPETGEAYEWKHGAGSTT